MSLETILLGQTIQGMPEKLKRRMGQNGSIGRLTLENLTIVDVLSMPVDETRKLGIPDKTSRRLRRYLHGAYPNLKDSIPFLEEGQIDKNDGKPSMAELGVREKVSLELEDGEIFMEDRSISHSSGEPEQIHEHDGKPSMAEGVREKVSLELEEGEIFMEQIGKVEETDNRREARRHFCTKSPSLKGQTIGHAMPNVRL